MELKLNFNSYFTPQEFETADAKKTQKNNIYLNNESLLIK